MRLSGEPTKGLEQADLSFSSTACFGPMRPATPGHQNLGRKQWAPPPLVPNQITHLYYPQNVTNGVRNPSLPPHPPTPPQSKGSI